MIFFKFFNFQEIRNKLQQQNTELEEIKQKIKILDEIEASFLEIHVTKIETVEDSISKLSSDLLATEDALFKEGELITKLESDLRCLRNTLQETSFKIQLYQARGHIDIKRLKLSASHLKVCQSEEQTNNVMP